VYGGNSFGQSDPVKALLDWLAAIGAIASIGAAIWAFLEAKKASESASKAETVRNEIIERRNLAELSNVHLETTRILKIVGRIGPASNPDQLAGIDPTEIASEVDEFTRHLNEHQAHFSDFFANRARELCDDLQDDISELAEQYEGAAIKQIGRRIYTKIHSFVPVVKALTDEKRERAPTE